MEPRLLDIAGAGEVEVTIRNDGKVLWVNIDGECRLRVCKIRRGVRIRGNIRAKGPFQVETSLKGADDLTGSEAEKLSD